MLGRLFRAQPDGTSGRGPDRNQGRKKGADPEGRALFVGPVFLNKIRVLCLFAGGRSHRRGGFFVRWGRRAPPVPAAAGVNLLRFPRPRRGRGTGGGRRTRQQTGTARNRREPPRAGGGAAGAPPPRNGPRAAEGGMAGRAPRVGAGPTGGLQGLPRPPRSGPRAAPPGARAGDSGPPPTAGAAHAPHLVRPGADPRRGRARGRRGTERGPGRREPPQGGPAAAAPRRPAARSAIPKGRRPAKKESAQAIKARTLSQVTRGSTPCRVIVPQRRRCCQAPGGGGPPYLIIGHYSVTGGRRGPCGRGDVPYPSVGCTGHGTTA